MKIIVFLFVPFVSIFFQPLETAAQTQLCTVQLQSGSIFSDIDCDGVINDNDVCPDNYDPGQSDRDGDRVGDACDPCPFVVGSVCPTDTDRDGIVDEHDVCPRLFNPDQVDTDGDRIGDACEVIVEVAAPIQNEPGSGQIAPKSSGCSLIFSEKPLKTVWIFLFPLIPLVFGRRQTLKGKKRATF